MASRPCSGPSSKAPPRETRITRKGDLPLDQVLSKDTLPALRDRLWWSLLWLLLGSCALGLLSLLYAVGPYGLPVFLSYLRHP